MHRRVFLSALALACAPAQRPVSATTTSTGSAIDSVVLERTVCFGTCPAYRLSLTRTGLVRFVSRNPGDTISAVDSVPAATADSIRSWAERAGFFALPDSIDNGAPLCPDFATDHPTIILSIYGRPTKRVHYYTGCYLRSDHTTHPVLESLARLASRIDSATQARRWIHPARRR